MSRSIFVSFLAVLFFGISISAFAEKITDSENGFSIEYPADWDVQKDVSGTDVMGFSKLSGAEDQFRENFSVGHEDLSTFKTMTLDKYFEISELNMKKAVSEFKRISLDDTKIAGVPAKKLVYTFKLNIYTIKGCMHLIKNDDTGYILTGTAMDQTFDEFNPVFNKIIESFKFVPKKKGKPKVSDSKIVNGRYINTKYNFSMDLPKNWEHADNHSGRIMFMFSPLGDNDTFRENINIGKEAIPSGMTQDAYMKLSVVNMKKMVEGLNDLGEKKLKINGLPARRLDYEFKMGEFDIKGMTYIVFYKNEAYLITCGMLKSTFDKYQDIMSKTAKSFKIEK